MNNIRILIVSNSCFSLSDSNGRTLAKYFSPCFSPNEIAQIYIHGVPDKTVCTNYYRISNANALSSFIKQREFGQVIDVKDTTNINADNTIAQTKFSRTPLNMLLRETVWKYGKWNGLNLNKWIANFSPTHIFIFLADNAFLLDFANELSVQLHIPIVAYSTENYYFKKYNYLTKRISFAYLLFRKKLKSSYLQCQHNISVGIFNTPMLTKIYDEEFSYPCKCLFPKSDIKFISNAEISKDGKRIVSYLGNLGLNRHKALIEIADTLNQISPKTKLHIYGKIPKAVKHEILSNTNISYEGVVDYETVISVMHHSDLLIHAEYNDDYYCRDLKFAFSTKIADSVSCGTPLFMYGSEQLAETDFLKNMHCAFVVNHSNDLKKVLETALFDANIRAEVVRNAERVREEYFSVNTGVTIREIIEQTP